MRLSVQITLVTTAVALFTAITAAVVAYRGAHASAVDRALAAAEARGRLVAQQLETRLRALRADAISLREGAAISALLAPPSPLSASPAAPSGGWEERLARDFAARLQASPAYLQIRLLDERGHERLRLARDASGEPRRHPANDMQDRQAQRYFTAASALDDGLVYLSTILSDAERGADAAAAVPLLRAAAPVRARRGAGRHAGHRPRPATAGPRVSQNSTTCPSTSSSPTATAAACWCRHASTRPRRRSAAPVATAHSPRSVPPRTGGPRDAMPPVHCVTSRSRAPTWVPARRS